jgi:hypothetical protein
VVCAFRCRSCRIDRAHASVVGWHDPVRGSATIIACNKRKNNRKAVQLNTAQNTSSLSLFSAYNFIEFVSVRLRELRSATTAGTLAGARPTQPFPSPWPDLARARPCWRSPHAASCQPLAAPPAPGWRCPRWNLPAPVLASRLLATAVEAGSAPPTICNTSTAIDLRARAPATRAEPARRHAGNAGNSPAGRAVEDGEVVAPLAVLGRPRGRARRDGMRSSIN